MRRSILPLVIGLAVCAGTWSSKANTIVWINTNGGNWSVNNNWNPHNAPKATDTAVITNAGIYTVTLDKDAAVAGLILGKTSAGGIQTVSINGKTLTLSGQATVSSNGVFNLSSGIFMGATNSGGAVFSGTLTPSGGALAGRLTLATNSVLKLTAASVTNVLNRLTLLTNYGTVTWSNLNLSGSSSLQIINRSLWDAQSDNIFFGNGTVFNNSGTFRKSAAGGNTTLDSGTAFNSTGTVDAQTGTLAIQAGTCSGTFNTVSGTVLNFGYSPSLVTFTLTGNSTFTGNGIVEGVLINGNNAMIGGTVTFSAASLYGSMTISNTAAVNFVGTLGQNTFSSITFNNYGTVNWSNTDLYVAPALSQMKIYNYGLWDAKTSNAFHGTNSFNNQFFNSGTFRKSSGGGTTTIDSNLTFRNTGTVDVLGGTLEIQNVYGDIKSSGTFNIAANAEVYFSVGVYGFLSYAGTSFTGSGSILGNLTGASGGSNVISGNITYLGGTLQGPLMVASNAVLNLPVGASCSSANLANYGTVNWILGDLYDSGSSQFNNYGLWDAQSNNTFHGSSTVFNNYGTFRKSGGTINDSSPYQTLFDTSTTFNNLGTLDVQSGQVTLKGGAGNGVFNNATNCSTVFALFSGSPPQAYILTDHPTFTGPGVVFGSLNGFNAVIQGALNYQAQGTIFGTLTVASNATFNLLSTYQTAFGNLLLTNYGTVNWFSGGVSANVGAFPKIDNFGLWNATANGTMSGPVFNNYGTFRKSGGTINDSSPYQTLFDTSTTFNNLGTLDVQSGQVTLKGGAGNGVFNNATNCSTVFALFSGSPPQAYILTDHPTFTGPGVVFGSLNGFNAVIQGALNYQAQGTIFGTLTVASNATFNLLSTYQTAFGNLLLTNYGTVNWFSGGVSANVGAFPKIDNFGLWNATANGTMSGPVFNNYGTFRKSGGTINDSSPYQTLFDTSTTFNNLGTLDVQTGAVSLGGNYVLGAGTLNFGISSANNFGSVYLNGNAALAGGLSVALNNNYSPGTGRSFPLVSYGSETGNFSALTLPHLAGLAWQTNYGATSFTVSVTNLPPVQLSSVTALNGGSISFSWNTVDGQNYQVQYTTNLAPAVWVNLGNSITGTNGTSTVSDALGTNPQKFYRVVVSP